MSRTIYYGGLGDPDRGHPTAKDHSRLRRPQGGDQRPGPTIQCRRVETPTTVLGLLGSACLHPPPIDGWPIRAGHPDSATADSQLCPPPPRTMGSNAPHAPIRNEQCPIGGGSVFPLPGLYGASLLTPADLLVENPEAHHPAWDMGDTNLTDWVRK